LANLKLENQTLSAHVIATSYALESSSVSDNWGFVGAVKEVSIVLEILCLCIMFVSYKDTF